GLLRPARGDIGWRLAFMLGLVGSPLAWLLFAAPPALRVDASYGVLVAAGLLVGLGTRYGAGCTSGHGICGLSRLSPRSALATAPRRIDRRLVGGSLLFGLGWGLAGFCPGPALVALGLGEPKALVFVVAMWFGMALFEWLERRIPAGLRS